MVHGIRNDDRAWRALPRQLDTLMGTVLAELTPADRDSLAALLGSVINTLGDRPQAAGLR